MRRHFINQRTFIVVQCWTRCLSQECLQWRSSTNASFKNCITSFVLYNHFHFSAHTVADCKALMKESMKCKPNVLFFCAAFKEILNVVWESNFSTAYRDFSHKNRFWMRPTQSCFNFLPYRLQPSPWRRRRYPQSRAPFQIGTNWAEWSEMGTLRWSTSAWSTRLAGRMLWRSSTRANAEERWDGCIMMLSIKCLFFYNNLNNTFLFWIFFSCTGAYDPEWGGYPQKSETPKHCVADWGNGHLQWTLPGHGAC